LIQLTNTSSAFLPLPGWLHGSTGRIGARFGNRSGDHGHAGNEHVVAYLDVANHADTAGNHAVAPDLGAAGNTAATGHGGVVADLHVVRDHDLVIQLDAVADQRIGQCPAVDGGVRTDLDVIANGHATDLGNLLPDALLVGEAEALAADHRAGLDDNPLADHHVVIKRDARRQPATLANARTRADHAMGPDANARANLRAAL